MKKLLIIFIFLLLVISAIALKQNKKYKDTLVEEIDTGPDVETLCFERITTGTAEAPYSVNETIQMTLDGGKVVGTKSGTQAGPDMTNGYEGTLFGTQAGDNLSVLFSYTIEGATQSEQEEYVLKGISLFKQRYPLIESQGVLVPDTSKPFVEQEYTSIQCKSETLDQ